MCEGYANSPYFDSGGVKTDGFGNTHNVGKNKTVPQHLAQLEKNTSEAGEAVSHCITNSMSQNQYDALVSLVFNIGSGNFCKSTLVKKFNAGDKIGGCNEIIRWDRVNGVPNKGLAKRRQQERQLCLS